MVGADSDPRRVKATLRYLTWWKRTLVREDAALNKLMFPSQDFENCKI